MIYVKCSGGSGSSRGTDPVSIKLKRRHRPGFFVLHQSGRELFETAWSLLSWHKADLIFVGMNEMRPGHQQTSVSGMGTAVFRRNRK